MAGKTGRCGGQPATTPTYPAKGSCPGLCERLNSLMRQAGQKAQRRDCRSLVDTYPKEPSARSLVYPNWGPQASTLPSAASCFEYPCLRPRLPQFAQPWRHRLRFNRFCPTSFRVGFFFFHRIFYGFIVSQVRPRSGQAVPGKQARGMGTIPSPLVLARAPRSALGWPAPCGLVPIVHLHSSQCVVAWRQAERETPDWQLAARRAQMALPMGGGRGVGQIRSFQSALVGMNRKR